MKQEGHTDVTGYKEYGSVARTLWEGEAQAHQLRSQSELREQTHAGAGMNLTVRGHVLKPRPSSPHLPINTELPLQDVTQLNKQQRGTVR